ncbi:hypothetical protein LPW11_05845 [Geomonas sp. RF6]|uniref:hypothetical protein n=1 Tax=Geomonas sp. RF6 TaxID=2897342 RepID=UPI001E6436CE|nr:hypothetical protein [Geomonas sp. RF6]UFS71713.1 hypothetical protein LPW11_05845 [Geomonas sp. RF6]
MSATATGYAKDTGTPMDVDNAVDAAKVVAQADLLGAIKEVRVDRQTSVGELMEERTEASIRVQGVLRNAFQSGEARVSKEQGYVAATVEMRVCLYSEGGSCRSESALASVLPAKRSGGKRARPASCDLTPDLESSREALAKVPAAAGEMPFFLVNVSGRPINSETRDISIVFEGQGGETCAVYAPDRVDPVVRRDRGTAEIFLREGEAKEKYGSGTIVLAALAVDGKNRVTVSKPDAYLMNLVNESKNDAPFRQARVGIAMGGAR